MTTSIYVDSRSAASGSGSDFEITLRETVHIQPGARLRVDKIRFVDSFFTTDLGRYLYYKDGSGGLAYFGLAEQAYTGSRLAAAIYSATGRNTTYVEATDQIQQAVTVGQELLSDLDLRSFATGFPADASSSYPRSLNAILGPAEMDSGYVTFNFVKMSLYDDL